MARLTLNPETLSVTTFQIALYDEELVSTTSATLPVCPTMALDPACNGGKTLTICTAA